MQNPNFIGNGLKKMMTLQKNELGGNDDNTMNEFLLMERVDTIDNELFIFKGVVEHSFHELYLRGFSQSKLFFHHHFPQTTYRQSGELPDELKKNIKKFGVKWQFQWPWSQTFNIQMICGY